MGKLKFESSYLVAAAGVLISFVAAFLVANSIKTDRQAQVEAIMAGLVVQIENSLQFQHPKITAIAVTLDIAPGILGAEDFSRLGDLLAGPGTGMDQIYLIVPAEGATDRSAASYSLIQGYPQRVNASAPLARALATADYGIPERFDRPSIAVLSPSGEYLTWYQTLAEDGPRAQQYVVTQLQFKGTIEWLLQGNIPEWIAFEVFSTDTQGNRKVIFRHPPANQSPAWAMNWENARLAQDNVDFLDHSLSISYFTDPESEPSPYFAAATTATLGVGLIITFIISFFMDLIRRIARRDERLKQAIIGKSEQLSEANERLLAQSVAKEQMLQELADSKEQLSLLTDAIDGVVWARDYKTNRYLHVSSGVTPVFGYTPEEVLATPNLLYDLILEEDKPMVRKTFEDNVYKGQSFQIEFRTYNRAGKIIYGRNVVSPVLKDGEVVAVCGVMFDVTKYKMMTKERNQMESQLRQAQKLESIGQLAAGIAHEINTPAQFVGDNIHFLQDAFKDLNQLRERYAKLLAAVENGEDISAIAEDIRSYSEEIDVDYLFQDIPDSIKQSADGINRISSIVKAMKAFSHPGTSEKELIDLNHAIDSTITVARNEWKYVAEVKTNFDPKLPMLYCMPGEINQTILNMVVNAAHAIEEKQKKSGVSEQGTIEITTSHEGDLVRIKVRDTGNGIPKAILDKIFDPFFTTKEVGKGTGQGLSLAFSVIVDKHQGSINVESEVGVGTTFIIELPFEKQASEPDSADQPQPERSQATG